MAEVRGGDRPRLVTGDAARAPLTPLVLPALPLPLLPPPLPLLLLVPLARRGTVGGRCGEEDRAEAAEATAAPGGGVFERTAEVEVEVEAAAGRGGDRVLGGVLDRAFNGTFSNSAIEALESNLTPMDKMQ